MHSSRTSVKDRVIEQAREAWGHPSTFHVHPSPIEKTIKRMIELEFRWTS
jgi:hypothetical protein